MSNIGNQMSKAIRRLFDITPVPTAMSSSTGEILYTNPALRKLLGYSETEILSPGVVLTHPEDIAINHKVREKLTQSPDRSVQVHKRYLHKDGHSILAQLNIVAETDDHGEVLWFMSQIVDLSGTRQSQAAELLLDQLVQKSHDAIYVADLTFGQILNCNELGYKRLGYTKEELLRLTVPDINPLFRKVMTWQEHVEQLKLVHNVFVEGTHKCKDGSEIPIEANVNLVEFNNEQYLLSIVRDISERKARELRTLEAQNLDPLTGLPNRRLLNSKLQDMLNHCRERSEKVAFMYLDIDNFKQINDTYGHRSGDEVLTTLASRLRDFTRQNDIVARLGGDEFLVVLPGLNSEEHVLSLADHLLQVTSHSIALTNGYSLNTDISVGATLCYGQEVDIATAISVADKAMYQAKTHPGSKSVFLDCSA